MMMRLQKYDVTVSYEGGEDVFLADLLSRAYLPKRPEPEDKEFEFVILASCVPISDPRLEEIRQETQADETMQTLMNVILQGWPDDKSSMPSLALPYFKQIGELTEGNLTIFIWHCLHDYRNTPSQGTNTNPAQRLMSRRAKTLLPSRETLRKASCANNS